MALITSPIKSVPLAALLGAVSVLGYAPLDWYPVPLLTLAVLFLLAGQAAPRHALLLGLAYGLGLFLTGLSWVYVSITTYGGMPMPIAVVATLLFCAVLALFPAFALWLATRFTSGALRLTLALPAAWTLGEWLRGWVLTGLPWLGLGYSQTPGPLAGYAPLLGVYGVGLVAAVIAGFIARLITPPHPALPTRGEGANRLLFSSPSWGRSGRSTFSSPTRWGRPGGGGLLSWAMLVLLLITGFGLQHIAWTQPVGEPVSVALLQGNVAQEMKFRPERLRATLDTYARQVLASEARLIVLPETALPVFRSQLPPGYLDLLAGHARSRDGDVLLGLPEDDGPARYYNSVISVGSSAPGRYRKHHLVPFGEFVPFGFRWAVDLMSIPLGDFSLGLADQAPIQAAGQRLAVNVCYEDVFGEERITAARNATLLVNVSNDAWFGASLAPWQHLQIGAMRSLETGRWQLRANNTGVTAVLDQRGQVRAQLPAFTPGTLTTYAQGRAGLTPYMRWGNWPVVLLAIALLALAAWRGNRYPARQIFRN